MRFLDLRGILGTILQFGIGGLQLKSTAGKIRARNAGDSADAPLVGSTIEASGDSVTLNEDATSAGADWKMTLSRPAAGMSQDLTFVLPPDYGTAGYALTTDGAGNLSFASSSAATNLEATDTTGVVYDSTATIAMFTLPANAVVLKAMVVIDESFDGTPSLSVGVTGELSRYMGSTDLSLTAPAGTIFEVSPGLEAEATTQDLIATYSTGSATAGAARILVSYVIPS